LRMSRLIAMRTQDCKPAFGQGAHPQHAAMCEFMCCSCLPELCIGGSQTCGSQCGPAAVPFITLRCNAVPTHREESHTASTQLCSQAAVAPLNVEVCAQLQQCDSGRGRVANIIMQVSMGCCSCIGLGAVALSRQLS
jgi:hypothetical protein